jgi:hypothetical protein
MTAAHRIVAVFTLGRALELPEILVAIRHEGDKSARANRVKKGAGRSSASPRLRGENLFHRGLGRRGAAAKLPRSVNGSGASPRR